MEKQLKSLLKVNADATEGYSYAASHIENDNFKNFLEAYSRQRMKYLEEVQAMMKEKNFESDYKTSISGDLHKQVLKLRNQFASAGDKVIVEECKRGEDEALEIYKKAMKSDELEPGQMKTVLNHFNKIRAARSTLDEMQRAL